MATLKAPIGEVPPFCLCGCGQQVSWKPGKGWSKWILGHQFIGKPGTRLGCKSSEETRLKMSESMKKHYAGIRKRDLQNSGPAVYSTYEYRDAKKLLVEGKACSKCGSSEKIHAHHVIPGDDSSLIPLCKSCHVIYHNTGGKPYNGYQPTPNSQAPLCACGCGRSVKWKRVRGWAKYCKGHVNAKIPGGSKDQEAPLCKCGCGEKTAFRHGKGWNEYKRGHGQRVYGHYKQRNKIDINPENPVIESK